MLPSFRDLKQEFRPMISLAAPVVVAEIGWVAMGLVDTLMVGPLGPEAIGAVGIGSAVFIGIVIFGMGVLLGLDTLVSQAYGAGRIDDCHRWLVHGTGAEPVRRVAGDAPALRPDQPARPVGARSDCPSPGATLPRRRRLECPATLVLRDLSPLPAGHGHRPAGHDRARVSQPRQRVRQLGAHLRQAWCAGDGRSRRRLGDRPLARDDGGVSVRRHPPT